jgi:hypothetical protein
MLWPTLLILCACPGPPDPGSHQTGGVKSEDVVQDLPPNTCEQEPAPRCQLRLTLPQFDFGILQPGDTAWGELVWENVGSGDCILSEWALTPCVFQDNTFQCDAMDMSAFTVVTAPEPGHLLRPGQKTVFSVNFQAPTEIGQSLVSLKHYARLAAFFADPCDPSSLKAAPTEGEQGINLMAGVDGAFATVNPSSIDFGVLREDCPSSLRTVTVTNAGPTPFYLTSAALKNCPVHISLFVDKELPSSIQGFKELSLSVVFQGQGNQNVECELELTTDAPNLVKATLDIRGSSTDFDVMTDLFVQTAKPKLDTLFVVDNSNSMSDEQEVLALGLPTLVEKASSAGQVVQMAVITTDALADSGVMVGSPPFVGGDQVEEFVNRLQVGLDGALMERGLESAWLALSGSNVEEGGPNEGFLRPDAELAIIVVSDEDDYSADDPAQWVQRFQGLKKLWSGVGVTVHAVVATSDDCSDLATIGSRYISVTQAFGGQVVNICSPNFAEQFGLQGNLAFSVKDRFYPTYPPLPASLQVRVGDALCTTGWEWNPTAKAVIFESNAACFPQLGEKVKLDYEIICP